MLIWDIFLFNFFFCKKLVVLQKNHLAFDYYYQKTSKPKFYKDLRNKNFVKLADESYFIGRKFFILTKINMIISALAEQNYWAKLKIRSWRDSRALAFRWIRWMKWQKRGAPRRFFKIPSKEFLKKLPKRAFKKRRKMWLKHKKIRRKLFNIVRRKKLKRAKLKKFYRRLIQNKKKKTIIKKLIALKKFNKNKTLLKKLKIRMDYKWMNQYIYRFNSNLGLILFRRFRRKRLYGYFPLIMMLKGLWKVWLKSINRSEYIDWRSYIENTYPGSHIQYMRKKLRRLKFRRKKKKKKIQLRPVKESFFIRNLNTISLEYIFNDFKHFLYDNNINKLYDYMTFKHYWTFFYYFLLKKQERFFARTIGKYYCLTMKKKRSNYYLTLINGYGMVVFYLSSGAFLKKVHERKRNRKLRSKYIYYDEFQELFIKKLRRRKIKYIKYFLQNRGLRKRFRYNIVYGLKKNRIQLGYIKNLAIGPHSLKKKSKKKRRL